MQDDTDGGGPENERRGGGQRSLEFPFLRPHPLAVRLDDGAVVHLEEVLDKFSRKCVAGRAGEVQDEALGALLLERDRELVPFVTVHPPVEEAIWIPLQILGPLLRLGPRRAHKITVVVTESDCAVLQPRRR